MEHTIITLNNINNDSDFKTMILALCNFNLTNLAMLI